MALLELLPRNPAQSSLGWSLLVNALVATSSKNWVVPSLYIANRIGTILSYAHPQAIYSPLDMIMINIADFLAIACQPRGHLALLPGKDS
jgi:hypothetical protein